MDCFFLFPLLGRVRIIRKSGTKVIGRGEYLMLPEGERHALEIDTDCAELHQLSLHCQIQDRWHHSLLNRFPRPFGKIAEPDACYDALKNLSCLLRDDPELAQSHGETFLRELLAARLGEEKNFAASPSRGDARIEHILRRIRQEMASPDLSVEALAREIELTPVQMRKLFQRETRTSPKQYLQRLRLQHAVQLLRHSTKSVKEVAAESGFASDAYFHLVFRKALDCTPTEYRERSIV